MTRGADVARISRGLEAVIRREGLGVRWRDPNGSETPMSPALAASPTGLLPALIVAGEAVWQGATGRGFDLHVRRDPDALLGWRLEGIGSGKAAIVLLATMEAVSQGARDGVLHGHALAPVWAEAVNRARAAERAVTPTRGPST